MEKNVERGMYATTEAFIADCKWILHNCILFNGSEWRPAGIDWALGGVGRGGGGCFA